MLQKTLKYSSILDYSKEDYPERTSSVIFLAGSPFKVGFRSYFAEELDSSYAEIEIEHLASRFHNMKANVEAVVFTGREPLEQGRVLYELLIELKEMGMLLKLETSGMFAENLKQLLPYLDAVSMDVLSELDAYKYAEFLEFKGEPATMMQDVLRSLIMLKEKKLENRDFFVEFQTPIMKGRNDSEETIEKIASEISFAGRYILNQGDTRIDKFSLISLAEVAKKHLQNVYIRTKEEALQKIS